MSGATHLIGNVSELAADEGCPSISQIALGGNFWELTRGGSFVEFFALDDARLNKVCNRLGFRCVAPAGR